MSELSYIGDELDVFAHAVNWKAYFGSRLAPYIRGRVLEVGAGIGGTTRALCSGTESAWVCLEPDATLAHRLEEQVRTAPFPIDPMVVVGTLQDLPTADRFDCILYIDVIEHIENDRAEVERAAQRLSPGGSLVVLCPAHQALYSPFDKAIGHYRRYNKKMMRAIHPPGVVLKELIYLDSIGLLLSIANRLLLRSPTPKVSQIKLWDRLFVPASRVVDPLLLRSVGKSIVAVWQKQAAATYPGGGTT